VVLLTATLYAFWLPFKGDLSLVDMGVLVAIFIFYMWRIAGLPAELPHLVGPAGVIGSLPAVRRRAIVTTRSCSRSLERSCSMRRL
jgi:cation:H+ antiporter